MVAPLCPLEQKSLFVLGDLNLHESDDRLSLHTMHSLYIDVLPQLQ